jgi:DNA-binding NarL/FixJ family response regulator
MHRHEEFVVKAFRAGASGYLVKSAAVDELHQALRVVAGGQTYVSPSVQAPSGEEKRDRSSDMTPLEQLSPRQREVLQLIAEGMSSRQIANMLGIKTKTVESHRTQLMHRLGIHDVAGLVRYAIRHGLVAVD